MSEDSPEQSTEGTTGISDDQLPDDLVPGEDNPLAEGLEPGEDAGDLFHDGKQAEESGDGSDDDVADTAAQGGDDTAIDQAPEPG